MLKSTYGIPAALFATIVAPQALAEFTPEQLFKATQVAVKDFFATQAGHAQHFTGYKTWKAGADAKTIVYVSHGGMNMEFKYSCHEAGDDVECEAQ